ncbi:unnamed protein product [Periconia digitata]|uniref:Superoxide dismutase copper/zinc binding domain-containing protein n=1 Tax=Periconia digitata TaxID=1303443 RepID=A0A9W4XIK0_9PLEO|nr:unnamed protein product [Periconia digitata]
METSSLHHSHSPPIPSFIPSTTQTRTLVLRLLRTFFNTMHATTLASTLAMAALVTAQTPTPKPSPPGIKYNATVEPVGGSNIHGYATLTSSEKGAVGISFRFENVNKDNGGPFPYRIHENSDCANPGPVYDPYKVGKGDENKAPLGDIGGSKLMQINVPDKINSNGFPLEALSLDPNNDKDFVGNRAFVITNGKEEKVACGVFKCTAGCNLVSGMNDTTTTSPGGANGTSGTNGTVNGPNGPKGPGAPGSGPATSPNSGTQLVASAGAFMVAFAAFLL